MPDVTLTGGPVDGRVFNVSAEGLPIETAVECPCPRGDCFDTARYGPDGSFSGVVCQHPVFDLRSRPSCCDLCPGHRVKVGTETHR